MIIALLNIGSSEVLGMMLSIYNSALMASRYHTLYLQFGTLGLLCNHYWLRLDTPPPRWQITALQIFTQKMGGFN